MRHFQANTSNKEELPESCLTQNDLKHLRWENNQNLTRNSISHPDTPISYKAESSTKDQRKGSIIMSNKQKEEKVIEELEKEGKLKKELQEGGEEYEDERPRQGYNCVWKYKKSNADYYYLMISYHLFSIVDMNCFWHILSLYSSYIFDQCFLF